MLGKTRSEETRQKMSESRKGEKSHWYGKPGIRLGKTHSDETKQKISLSGRNKKGVKGYNFNKNTNKYLARIMVGEKRIHLGCFNTPEEASQAYQQARLIYFV
jgi:hypothetical protein